VVNKYIKKFLSNIFLYRLRTLLREYKSYKNWEKINFQAPSPHYIKQACLIRNGFPGATWIETGTYLGQTTQVLSKIGLKVFSIEPEATLFANAYNYFKKFSNVEILNGTSEQIFPNLLPKIKGDVNFWLDGHYSAGITFKGTQDTPILEELKHIADNLNHFKKVCVLIDDVRCFNPKILEYSTYPSVNILVAWANNNNLDWHIEHDIFVAKN
jgi:hypothetical protein